MAERELQDFVQDLCLRLNAEQQAGLPDAHLLQRWVLARDEAAFELLVRRHGPLVLGVCRRMLNPADVEDAFQATFLLLVRKAASIRSGPSLNSWLHRVAFRVCLRAREGRGKRKETGLQEWEHVAAPDDDDAEWRDLRPVLDEEVSRLPEKYRSAFVLCHLQGKTNQEAADCLGCPLGTVLSRLSWARERLRMRLSKRGIAVSGTALTTILSQQSASAALPPVLLQTTLRLSLPASVGASMRAVTLAQGVMRAMMLTKIKWTAAALLFAGLLTFGTLSLTNPSAEAAPAGSQDSTAPPEKPPVAKPPVEKPPPAPPDGTDEAPKSRDLVAVPAQREGVIAFIGRQVRDDEKPEGRTFTVTIDGKEKKFVRLREGDRVTVGDVLVRLKDDLARAEVDIRKAKLAAAHADLRAAVVTREEAKVRYERVAELRKRAPGTVSEDEVRTAKLTFDRYGEEVRSKEAALQVAEKEVELATVILGMYEVRAPVSGKIKAVLKNTGEGVRQLEAVLHILPDEK